MPDKKYYWLKLKRDFFKRHDIQIIENMPNGKDYVLFYLKLLVESVDHDGALRFSDTIPYNDQMLSTITDTNIDIVRSAMKVFTELGMIEVLDDCTIYMTEVEKMLGSEGWSTDRVRRFRATQRALPEEGVTCNADVTECNATETKSKSKSKSLEIDTEIDKDNTGARTPFKPPNVEEVTAYCSERKNGIDAQSFIDFYESKGWMIGKNKMKDWKAAVRTWERSRKQEQTPKKFVYNDHCAEGESL